MRFYLIAKGTELRLTRFITATQANHHKALGWQVVESWPTPPHHTAVTEAGVNHLIALADANESLRRTP